ncbi:alpha/beta fold hydrolase [Ruminococcus gauvreauii]|uniref:alpha/beta fold hydrolase n=1 Tax=Ruminococcus gauvreauii TaxID=438033 RepID=UPI0039842610
MDIKLHYTERGEGEPLILLHGNGEDSGYFVHQINYFSNMFRVIAIDTRGHGKSPRGEKPFTIQQFAEDLKGFMDEHLIEKANVLGFSDGGNIALVFALKHPDKVIRLILNGANLDAAGVKASVQIPIVAGYKMASLFAGRSVQARRNAEMLGLMVNDPNIDPARLKALDVPVLVIAGQRDMIKYEHTRLIYESLPNAKIAVIPGDHFIANKNPETFNRLVGDFLLRNKKPDLPRGGF